MRCWLFGHTQLQLDFFQGKPFIGIGDDDGDVVTVNLCSVCKLVYWEVSHGINDKRQQAKQQGNSVRWS